jgi:hypothetical protein
MKFPSLSSQEVIKTLRKAGFDYKTKEIPLKSLRHVSNVDEHGQMQQADTVAKILC